MILVSFLYPNSPNARFDPVYYTEKHIPRVLERLGGAVKGVFVEIGVGTTEPGASAPFAAGFHALFESVETFQEALRPHQAELLGRVPDYTDITPVVQFGQVSVAGLQLVALQPVTA